MPAKVEILSDEPIMIATLTGHITAEDMAGVYEASVNLLDHGRDHLYRITNVREADSSFADMMKILMAAKDRPGSSIDPRISVIFVGRNNWIQMARDVFSKDQYGNVSIPVYTDLNGAFNYIREQMVNT